MTLDETPALRAHRTEPEGGPPLLGRPLWRVVELTVVVLALEMLRSSTELVAIALAAVLLAARRRRPLGLFAGGLL